MKGNRLKETPQEIEELRERIEQWRRTREKKMAMPEELWQAAVSLLDRYTPSQLCYRLRIGFEGLCVRATALGLQTSGFQLAPAKAMKSRPDRADGTEFMMVEPLELFANHEQTASMVELVGADGSRMTIRVSCQHSLDLVGLSRSFWGRNTCFK